jgi:hypothetical protein
MIVEVKVLSIKCDGCGKEFLNEEDHCYYPDRSSITDAVQDDESWHTDESKSVPKHYCPNCWIYDNEGEVKLTIKNNP